MSAAWAGPDLRPAARATGGLNARKRPRGGAAAALLGRGVAGASRSAAACDAYKTPSMANDGLARVSVHNDLAKARVEIV